MAATISKYDATKAWLSQQLADGGPHIAGGLIAAGFMAGYGEQTIHRAARAQGVYKTANVGSVRRPGCVQHLSRQADLPALRCAPERGERMTEQELDQIAAEIRDLAQKSHWLALSPVSYVSELGYFRQPGTIHFPATPEGLQEALAWLRQQAAITWIQPGEND